MDEPMSKEQARITLLEDALEQAQNTVSFLHGCLTNKGFHYAYPEQTLLHLREWAGLVPVPQYCVHSRMVPEECESCKRHIAKREKLAEAYQVLEITPPWEKSSHA